MTIELDAIRGMLKAAAWERAKGELRSIAMIEGQDISEDRHDGKPLRFQVIEARVEAFIKIFENEGLQE
jgi:hypothetical protein